MKLTRPVIVERHGQIEIIPAGTLIETITPEPVRMRFFPITGGRFSAYKEFAPITPAKAAEVIVDGMMSPDKIAIYFYGDDPKTPVIGVQFSSGHFIGYGLGGSDEISQRALEAFGKTPSKDFSDISDADFEGEDAFADNNNRDGVNMELYNKQLADLTKKFTYIIGGNQPVV